jgi:hypothetical protein
MAVSDAYWEALSNSLEAKIWDLLNAVSVTPAHEWIAEELERRGIKGRREKPCDCPLSRLVQPLLPPDTICHVDGGNLEVYLNVDNYLALCKPLVSIKLPEYFTDFVYEFDCGLYPALIDLAA